MAVVVLGNAVGLVANTAAAIYSQNAAEAASAASAIFAANSTTAMESYLSSQRQLQLSVSINSIQLFCEVAVLLLIVTAFLVAGVICARAVSSRLRAMDAASASAAAGRELRRQVVVTTAVVFIAFVLRSVYATMTAVARHLQNTATRCPPTPGVTVFCDPSCRNVFALIDRWMSRTPEFQVTIILMSSPLALLVALWGMTSKQTLQTMNSSQRNMASTSARLLR